jgi:hypothetical protein
VEELQSCRWFLMEENSTNRYSENIFFKENEVKPQMEYVNPVITGIMLNQHINPIADRLIFTQKRGEGG